MLNVQVDESSGFRMSERKREPGTTLNNGRPQGKSILDSLYLSRLTYRHRNEVAIQCYLLVLKRINRASERKTTGTGQRKVVRRHRRLPISIAMYVVLCTHSTIVHMPDELILLEVCIPLAPVGLGPMDCGILWNWGIHKVCE